MAKEIQQHPDYQKYLESPDYQKFQELQKLIEGKLGLSLRTVRRRVADLMTELGADSRFQAGVEAARRGWL